MKPSEGRRRSRNCEQVEERPKEIIKKDDRTERRRIRCIRVEQNSDPGRTTFGLNKNSNTGEIPALAFVPFLTSNQEREEGRQTGKQALSRKRSKQGLG